MEETFSDKQGEFQDEKDACRCLNNDNGLEEYDNSVCSTSDLKTTSEDMGRASIVVDKKYVDAEKCIHKSYLQSQCDNELTIRKYMSLVNPSKNLVPYDHLTEFEASSYPSIICRAPTFFNIPVNLRSSKFLFKSFKPHRRTRSTNDLGDFVIEYASTAGPGNVIVNPFGQWIIDTGEVNDKLRSILKGSLFFRFGDLNGTLRPNRTRSVDISETKSLELNNSPNRIYAGPIKKPRAEVMPLGKQRSALKISDKTFVSFSSTTLTSSYDSSSSAQHTISKGLLHCEWKSGVPYFVFTVDDSQGVVYMANQLKVKSSDDKALAFMYLFHSSGCRKDLRSFGNSASYLVGKMKVSSSLNFNSNRSKFTETEFVLFGANENHSKELQNLSTHTRSRRLSKKMADIFRANNSSKHKSSPRVAQPSSHFEDFLQEPCLDNLNKLDESDRAMLLENHFPSNLELAAIVVKDYQHDNCKETAVGGWGLKFLEKVTVGHDSSSPEVPFSSENLEGSCMEKKNGCCRSLNVLVPAGFHGGPMSKTGGPFSLTERWRSGGQCDCGGWDVGCPLTVLNNRSTDAKVFYHEDLREDHKSVDLFIEGAKQGEPTLKMVNMQEGLYAIYFQSNLSALQSFSVGVAVIHAQTPSLRPKL